jgi:hypothetical protein
MQWLIALLNGHQALYIALCYLSLATTIGLGARALRPGWIDLVSGENAVRPHWRAGLPFLLALAASVALFRLPNLLTDHVLEPDECGHIISGWSLLRDPVPWRGSDHGSSGPLNSYVLTAAFHLGMPVSLMTSRIVLLVLLLLLIGYTYATLVKIGGQCAAVLPALALGLFACLAGDQDHTHYNSESVPVVLLAGAVLLHVVGRGRPSGGLPLVFGAGLLLGATPYAKLQAAPMGCYLAAAFALDLWLNRSGSNGWWRRMLALVIGGLSVPLLFAIVLAGTGTWRDFTKSYLGFASNYGFQGASRLTAAAVAFCGPDMPWFLLYCLAAVVGLFCCLERVPWPLPRRVRLLLGGALGYLAVAVYTVQAPKTGFSHYTAFVLHPAALLLGICTGEAAGLLAAGVRKGRQRAPKVAVALVLAATLALVGVHIARWRVEMPPQDDFMPTLTDKPGTSWVPFLPIVPRDRFQVADFIGKHARAGDSLSVWGWASHYYLYAQVPSATRYAVTILAMPPTAITAGVDDTLRAFCREKYLGDLQRARPAFFVDAVSGREFVCKDRQIWGHETWPELARFVAENYAEVFEVAVAPGNATRVYMLKERSASTSQSNGAASVPRRF